MSDRVFTLFLSSASVGMDKPRKAFMDVLQTMGQFFVGMEYFVGGYDPTWVAIERELERSDGLILLLAGKYGSLVPGQSVSYTEKEFDWAQAHDLPTIVFMRDPTTMDDMRYGDVEQSDDLRKRLQEFCKKLGGLEKGRYVNMWKEEVGLSNKAGPALSQWLREKVAPDLKRGWRRAAEDSETRQLKLQRDIYRYLFNVLFSETRLRLSVGAPFIEQLAINLDRTRDLTSVIETMLREYAQPQLPEGMRVYLAQELLTPVEVPGKPDIKFRYRLFISHSRAGDWERGALIGERSNIHYVFESGGLDAVSDSEDENEEHNAPVQKERSLVNVAITCGNKVVAVLGLSSPNPQEATKDALKQLATELGLILSALMYAYGQSMIRRASAGVQTIGDAAQKIQEELCIEYDNKLQWKGRTFDRRDTGKVG